MFVGLRSLEKKKKKSEIHTYLFSTEKNAKEWECKYLEVCSGYVNIACSNECKLSRQAVNMYKCKHGLD